MHLTVDTEIAAPRQVVWGYIVDPARHLKFMDGMTRWEVEGSKRVGHGARVAVRMRVGSVELGGRIEIVEFDPPCDMAWTSVAGVDHRGRWRLRPTDGDRTRVELRMIYHAPGGILSYLVDLAAAPVLKRHLQRSLTALKQQVEASPRAGKRPVPRMRGTGPDRRPSRDEQFSLGHPRPASTRNPPGAGSARSRSSRS
jgi:uncharacterized membrane protein